MPISLVDTAETTLTGTATNHNHTLTATAIEPNDLILIWPSTQEMADAGAPATPVDYLEEWSLGHASQFRPRITCVYKIADGSEESDVVNFDWNPTLVETHIVSAVFRGVDPNNPFDVTETGPTNGANDPDPASITTATDGAWVIAVAAGNRAPTSDPTMSSGYLELFDQSPDDRAFAICYKEIVTAGTDNPGPYTWNPIDNHTTVTMALRPAGGGLIVPKLSATRRHLLTR